MNSSRLGQREDFRFLFDTLPGVGLWTASAPGQFDYVNAGFEEIWGVTVADSQDDFSTFIEGIHPDDRERIRDALDRPEEELTERRDEYRVVQPDGTVRWVDARVVPLRDDAGDVEEIVGMMVDITEQKRREAEYREQSRQLRGVLDTVDVSIWMKDLDGTYLLANQNFIEDLDVSTEDVTGKQNSELFPEAVARQFDENDREVIERGEPREYRESVPTEGETREFLTRLNPLPDEDGDIYAVCGVSTDITKQVQRERRLKRKNEQLDQFASIVSHDLRNPLNVASGRIALAREECESEHLDVAARSLDRIEELIEDLLSLAREGSQVKSLERVELAPFLQECWRNVDTKDATLLTEIDTTIDADQSRFKQLCENVFRNAVEHGGDDVTVTVGELEDGFYIEDDGPGIAEANLERAFEPGYTTSTGGTGFGLSIVKQVVDAHGWSIDLMDRDDGGVRFEITGV